jgi:hypothetical protein
MTTGADRSCTRPPARAGPTIELTDWLRADTLLACMRSVLPTSDGTYEVAATSEKRARMPVSRATTYSASICRIPSSANVGMLPNRSAWPRSARIRIGRRGQRSTHTPAGRPSKRCGRKARAPSRPIWTGVALSTTTAVSGSARVVTADPTLEIACPVQSLKNSGCRLRTVQLRCNARPFPNGKAYHSGLFLHM